MICASHAAAGTITVKGSDTMVVLAQKWAEAYMRSRPGTRIQVNGGGSGIGLAALQAQSTDLCNSSRKIRSTEIAKCVQAFGARPVEYKVAMDGLSVFVHASNPVRELTLDQLRQIFTGKAMNWKEFGGPDAPIKTYSRENSSGTYEFFKEHVLLGQDFAAKTETKPGTASVFDAVAKDRHGIGYGGAAFSSGARTLAIRKDASSPAVDPSEQAVWSGTYPMSRYLYIYVNPAVDTGETAEYLKWIRSEAGQECIREAGYYPLPARQRN